MVGAHIGVCIYIYFYVCVYISGLAYIYTLYSRYALSVSCMFNSSPSTLSETRKPP